MSSREEFLSYMERSNSIDAPREILRDVARGSRDEILWPLVSIPKGMIVLFPEFLVFLTDDERSRTSRVVSFSATGVATRFVPLFGKFDAMARALGLSSFDHTKALNNPQSFFLARREIVSARPFWRATHGGIVHLRTRAGEDFYIYQDMHSTATWRYFLRGGWRWQKNLAAAIMRST